MTTVAPSAPGAASAESRWQDFFAHPAFPRFAQAILPPERTAVEVAALIGWLGLRPGSRVLDLGCGYGRIAVPLAQHGCRVTGVDASPAMLAMADEQTPPGLSIEYRPGDMRALDEPAGRYDAVINMSTAFGYVDDPAGELGALARVAAALRPGGTFLIDTENRDSKVRTALHTEFAMADTTIVCDRDFDVLTGRWTETMTWPTPAGTDQATFDVRLYAATELMAMLRDAGLTPVSAWGWFDGSAYTLDSPRMILAARRPLD